MYSICDTRVHTAVAMLLAEIDSADALTECERAAMAVLVAAGTTSGTISITNRVAPATKMI